MNKTIVGKCLVRKGVLNDGEQVLILCGVFFPKDLDLDDIADTEEMWVAPITIHSGGIRCTDIKEHCKHPSPEDFLTGRGMNLGDWNTHTKF